jgi:polyisoprenoid-binding protein YceI
MMNTKVSTVFGTLAFLSVLSLGGAARAATWEIDPAHTSAGFKVRHLMVSNVKGEFTGVTGKIDLDEKDLLKSKVEVSMDVGSVNTGNAKRDEHLKTADFFDAAKFPKLTFKSTKIEKQGDKLAMTGDLTLHGVTKPVVLMVELTTEIKDPWGNTRRGANATGKVNRKDFGLTWNKTLDGGGVAVSDEVQLNIEAELTKGKDKPAAPAK